MVRELLWKCRFNCVHHRLGAFPEHCASDLIGACAPASSSGIPSSSARISAADTRNPKSRNAEPDAPAAAGRASLSRTRTVNRAVIRRHLRAHGLSPRRVVGETVDLVVGPILGVFLVPEVRGGEQP